jgi:hypothetical protein
VSVCCLSENHEEYDDSGGRCHVIPKEVLLPGMQEIIDSEFFKSLVVLENSAYDLANRSLDLTSDEVIGREQFNKALATFRQVVEEMCSEETVFLSVPFQCNLLRDGT